MLKATLKKDRTRLLLAVFGSFIYAVGVNMFMVPLGLYTGGFLGLGQVIRTVVLEILGGPELPIDLAGVILYAFNIPLIIVAYRIMGTRFFRNMLVCSTTYALFAAIVPVPVVPIVDDMLTGCLLGGVISGAGTGLVLTCGCCGGGLDALGLYLAKGGVKITVGQFNLVFNGALFLACGILFNVETMIYSVLTAIFQAIAIDRAHQQSVNVQVLIFTKVESETLNDYIMNTLHRGITRWEGKGVFTGADTHILCVCLSKFELDDLRQAVYQADSKAFFIIQEGVHISNNFERRLS